MTSPVTMRPVGLLLIVGMVAGCGTEPTAPQGAAAIVGTYRLDVEKSVEQAVEMALVHDADWKIAKSEEERVRAREAFVETERHNIELHAQTTLTLRTDGTFENTIGWPESPGEGVPSVYGGTWHASGNEVTLVQTHEDGRPSEAPFETRWMFSAGSLYAHPDTVQRERRAKHTGDESEPGRVTIPLVIPVMTKDHVSPLPEPGE